MLIQISGMNVLSEVNLLLDQISPVIQIWIHVQILEKELE